MFSWLWRKRSPAAAILATRASNPGLGVTARIAFANGQKSWTEEINVVKAAALALTQSGHPVLSHDTWLEHRESGFSLYPQFVELQPLQNSGVRTVTTIEVRHPQLVPAGIFEFQHATGDSSQVSITSGIEQWAKLDFVPLREALRETPKECLVLQMTFPRNGVAPDLQRRAVLGPVAHYAQLPASVSDNNAGSETNEHPFCQCCLLTNTFTAFKSLLEADEFCGIRLYAARNENGRPEADCRVNGQDWEVGKRALRKYAKTWPERGFEFRKQYVVLQSLNREAT